jgi:hypothetical protein
LFLLPVCLKTRKLMSLATLSPAALLALQLLGFLALLGCFARAGTRRHNGGWFTDRGAADCSRVGDNKEELRRLKALKRKEVEVRLEKLLEAAGKGTRNLEDLKSSS